MLVMMPVSVFERFGKQVFNLGVHAAQVVIRPLPDRFQYLRVDAQQKAVSLGHCASGCLVERACIDDRLRLPVAAQYY